MFELADFSEEKFWLPKRAPIYMSSTSTTYRKTGSTTSSTTASNAHHTLTQPLLKPSKIHFSKEIRLASRPCGKPSTRASSWNRTDPTTTPGSWEDEANTTRRSSMRIILASLPGAIYLPLRILWRACHIQGGGSGTPPPPDQLYRRTPTSPHAACATPTQEIRLGQR